MAFWRAEIKSDSMTSAVSEFGSQIHSLPELSQIHRTIELSVAHNLGISESFADLYAKGLSLSDIAKQTGAAKTTIRSTLIRNGVELRENLAAPISIAIKTVGKGNAQPYFGFCYFQGTLVPNPKEYDTLLLIYNHWKLKLNPNSISSQLNEKKLSPRTASEWNRNSIVKIIERFENGMIRFEKGQLHLLPLANCTEKRSLKGGSNEFR